MDALLDDPAFFARSRRIFTLCWAAVHEPRWSATCGDVLRSVTAGF